MRAPSGQHRGYRCDGKDAGLYCTYEQYTSKIFQQARGGKKRYTEAMRRPGGGSGGALPADTGAKIPFDLPIHLGLSQPGMTIACGDSHTSTHGAVGAIAFGIGTTQVRDVL